MNLDHTSPKAYAKHLAGYIKDASKIAAYTKREYGAAPPRDEIERMLRDAAPKPVSPKPEKPFPCGHARHWNNIYETQAGYERCKTCSDEREAAREKVLQERLEREAIMQRERKARIALARLQIGMAAPSQYRSTAIQIIGDVADAFNLPVDEMKGPSRFRPYVAARLVAYRLLRDKGLSLTQIGRLLSRDHSSVLHGCQNFEDKAKLWPEVNAAYQALREKAE